MKTSPEHINLFGKFVVVLSRLKLFFAQRASEITAVNSFHPVRRFLNIPGKFPTLLWFFQTLKFQLKATVYALVFTTNLQIHSYLWYSSSQPSHVKNFIPFSQFLRLRQLLRVTTLIFRKNQGQCASVSINVAVLFPSFKRVTTVPNKFIESQQQKQPRRKTLTAFLSLSYFTFTTRVKSIILKNFKLLHFIYVVTTLIFRKNQIQCASFSINVAILFLSFKRVTPEPDKLIESQH